MRMIVNLKQAEAQFLKYTENFDLENDNIIRKRLHSLRVMNNCEKIAKDLECSQIQVEIAEVIGLLHDIARFKQYTEYNTFNDLNSFDHGDFGVKILERDLRKYIKDDSFDDIIKIAVKNHNKYQIEGNLTEEQEFFSKIIRDADKIDILAEATNIFWVGKEKEIEKLNISEEVLDFIKNERTVKRNKNFDLNLLEHVISIIALIYDINFKKSYEIIYEEKYITKIFNRFDIKDEKTKLIIQDIEKEANNFIKKKIS